MPPLALQQAGRPNLPLWGISLTLSALAFTISTARGQAAADFSIEPNWSAVCKTATAEPLPTQAGAFAGAAHASQNARQPCDETSAYYGFDRPPDYAKALRCAYAQRDTPVHEVGSFVWGPGTLSMLYANGYGVPRDYTLAIRFACEQAPNSVVAESESRIGHLEALRNGKLPADKPFDLCDDETSGILSSYCEDVQQKLADVTRGHKVAQLKAHLPEAAQTMLPRLEAAEAGFEEARGSGEYSGGGGSGSSSFKQADQGASREQFVINLQRFASGDLPKATPQDRERAEQALQAASRTAQNFHPRPRCMVRRCNTGLPFGNPARMAVPFRRVDALRACRLPHSPARPCRHRAAPPPDPPTPESSTAELIVTERPSNG